jgi:hypothetical protein
MRIRFTGSIKSLTTGAILTAVAVSGAFWLTARTTSGQAARRAPYRAPRTPDGKPNLNGIWEAMNSANSDLLEHAARPSPVIAMGALGATPGGLSVVDGNEIPYTPAALEKKKQNAANRITLDPLVKCYLPGVPRANYLPFPFQIVQTPDYVLMAYEFASASRTIYMNGTDKKGGKEETPLDSWMGWSRGHWEGETLVVDVTAFNDETWFDTAGDYHSDALHVVERYTATDADHLMYEATIEDKNVFTRPWKIHMPLYRRVEEHAQLFEFKCVEFVEELMYGHLRKRP